MREVIHQFDEIGPACLDPRWAGGRPGLLTPDDEDCVVQTATTRPTKLGQPFTRWSIRRLAAYLRKVHGRVIGSAARRYGACSGAAETPSSAPRPGRSPPIATPSSTASSTS
ncbi:helix-turn-helix domain-containing protein [Streptomyces brevispora]|uniref:helix-turn-helix domain-containing protein n=1 Tax=Streptomyces brevispora TaxID=887462 RepID=UPI003CC71385